MSERVTLPPAVREALERANPWWQGQPAPAVPSFRRHDFGSVRSALASGLAPVVALRGPRQVGKTTLALQLLGQLFAEGTAPRRLLRVQFDALPELAGLTSPLLHIAWWFEDNVLGRTFNAAAQAAEPAFFVFDEVQDLPDWSTQLKHLVDINAVRGLVTGSSSLRIEAGRDSLAGRITTLEMGPLRLGEVAALRGLSPIPPLLPRNGLALLKERATWEALRAHGESHRAVRDEAFRAFSERGSYPFAHMDPSRPWEQVADHLAETVVRRAVQHDLATGAFGAVRDEAFAEEVFRLVCRYTGQVAGQATWCGEIEKALGRPVAWPEVLSCLEAFDDALLVRLVRPLEMRLRTRAAGAKPCLCDHSLRAAWLYEAVPLDPAGLEKAPHLDGLAGRIAESVVGAYLSAILWLDVTHLPARSGHPEVDFVVTVGEQRIPVEVKYRRRIDHPDTVGLRAFMEKPHNNAPFGLLVTLLDDAGSDDPRIVSLPLSSLLLLR